MDEGLIYSPTPLQAMDDLLNEYSPTPLQAMDDLLDEYSPTPLQAIDDLLNEYPPTPEMDKFLNEFGSPETPSSLDLQSGHGTPNSNLEEFERLTVTSPPSSQSSRPASLDVSRYSEDLNPHRGSSSIPEENLATNVMAECQPPSVYIVMDTAGQFLSLVSFLPFSPQWHACLLIPLAIKRNTSQLQISGCLSSMPCIPLNQTHGLTFQLSTSIFFPSGTKDMPEPLFGTLIPKLRVVGTWMKLRMDIWTSI